MAWTNRTFNIIHSLENGSYILDDDTTATGYVDRIPETYYSGDSFALNISVYETYPNTLADFGPTASGALFLKAADTSDIPTHLAVGTVAQPSGQSEYSQVGFVVPSGVTSPYAGQSCLLYAMVTDTDGQVTISQQINITSIDGDGSSNPNAYQMPYTPADATDWSTTPDDVAEALDTLADDLTTLEAHTHTTATHALDCGLTTVTGQVYTVTASGWVDADSSAEATARGIMGYATDTEGAVTILGTVDRTGTMGDILYLAASGVVTPTVTPSGIVRVIGYQTTSTAAEIVPNSIMVEVA
jgi:hypothetical protein